MRNLVRPNGRRVAVLALFFVLGGASLALTGAPGAQGPPEEPGFKHPKLEDGVLKVKGTRKSDAIALRLKAGDAATVEVDVGNDGSADFSFARGEIAQIAVAGRAGDDEIRVDDSNGAVTNGIPTTIDGGDGDDTLDGGAGAESLLGGDGDDTIDGNGGTDSAVMGSGDDTFIWDPGDGSDAVEGENGADTMLFNGANGAEQMTLSANGSRLTFFRVQGAITMDTAGVERVAVKALGGADVITINDLAGTDVDAVDIDLAGVPGGAAGDAQPDRVVVKGTNGDDAITVDGDAGGILTSGLAAAVGIEHAEAANDRLEIETLDGIDTLNSAGLAAGTIQLLFDGVLVP
jgi:Ca2+-binding RTX toxin-like protein